MNFTFSRLPRRNHQLTLVNVEDDHGTVSKYCVYNCTEVSILSSVHGYFMFKNVSVQNRIRANTATVHKLVANYPIRAGDQISCKTIQKHD